MLLPLLFFTGTSVACPFILVPSAISILSTASVHLLHMSPYPHPIIAREGWPYISIAVLVALVVVLLAGWLWSLPLWIVAVFVLQFFRDPPREVPQGEG